MTADYTLWHDGARWWFETSAAVGVSRGWRPTRKWAKRAASHRVHRIIDARDR